MASTMTFKYGPKFLFSYGTTNYKHEQICLFFPVKPNYQRIRIHFSSAKKKFPAIGAPRSRPSAILEMSPRALSMRAWCEMGWDLKWEWLKPKGHHSKWPLNKQQNSMAIILKQPTWPIFCIYWVCPKSSICEKAKCQLLTISQFEVTCSLEIPCWQFAAAAKPTGHNDEGQSLLVVRVLHML